MNSPLSLSGKFTHAHAFFWFTPPKNMTSFMNSPLIIGSMLGAVHILRYHWRGEGVSQNITKKRRKIRRYTANIFPALTTGKSRVHLSARTIPLLDTRFITYRQFPFTAQKLQKNFELKKRANLLGIEPMTIETWVQYVTHYTRLNCWEIGIHLTLNNKIQGKSLT